MNAQVATRERILEEALTLFADRGVKGTTITQIESAAGLTPGAGGVFHHFASKRALLVEAIERRFQQIEALNQIRSIIPPLGDRRAELRLFARYFTDQIAEERALLVLVLREARNDFDVFADAVRLLLDDRERSFARWLAGKQPDHPLDPHELKRARLAIGALAYPATIDALLGRPADVPDDDDIETWVDITEQLMKDATD